MPINTIYKSDLFENKSYFITGGASGIGLRVAEELASLGAKVIIASRNLEKLENQVNRLNDEGYEVEAVVCDIKDPASIERALMEAIAIHERFDGLVNCAGGQFPCPANEMPYTGWQAVIQTNLTGTFFMSQQMFNKVFEKQKYGCIVNVIANIYCGFPGMVHTGAARAGVDNITKTLANEWGSYGVRVNSVAPGTIESSGLDNYTKQFKEKFSEIEKMNQASRFGTVAEVASGIIFLLSPASQYITGATLYIDAGESIFKPYAVVPNRNKWDTWE